MILFNAEGKSKLFADEDVDQAISEGWAETPAAFGIETCPGVVPDPDIAARASKPSERPDIEMSPNTDNLDTLSREELLEVAYTRSIIVDKRWGKDRILEALSGDSA